MATPGEQQQAAAEEVVSVEMPAPDGWTKKVRGDDDLLPLPACSLARSLDRPALCSASFRVRFGGSRGGNRGARGSWEAEFDFHGREF